jgi:hypothetical protein
MNNKKTKIKKKKQVSTDAISRLLSVTKQIGRRKQFLGGCDKTN